MESPGRVRRATTDDGPEAVSIRRYAEHYVSYKREFPGACELNDDAHGSSV